MDTHFSIAKNNVLKSLSTALMAFALLMSFDSEALAADSYAIFSLDSNFDELNITKARKLYRGKTKRLQGKRIELSDWYRMRHLNVQSSTVIYSIKTRRK